MTTSRACATCGQTFQVDPRNPRQRYCTPRCPAADWRRRHNRVSSPNPGNAMNNNRITLATLPDDANAVTPSDGVGNAVTPSDGVANDDRRAVLAGCPHCHAPVAVLTLLVPPAAAHVATPPAHHA
jgi:endogenous inhibitor of DNA gyrase (YacG/DUF329 family)